MLVVALPSMAAQDPTKPLNWKMTETAEAKAVEEPLPTLQSLVCDDRSYCYAIINHQIVSKGDSVSGYNVRAINANYLTLEKGQKQWKLTLFSLDIKK